MLNESFHHITHIVCIPLQITLHSGKQQLLLLPSLPPLLLSNGARCIGSCMLCVVCTAARALGACFFFFSKYPSVKLLCNACFFFEIYFFSFQIYFVTYYDSIIVITLELSQTCLHSCFSFFPFHLLLRFSFILHCQAQNILLLHIIPH